MGHIMAKFRQQNKSFDVKLPKRSDGSGRQPRPLHPTPEAENAFVDFQGLMHFRFMVSTHAKFFVVFPFYEPTAVPPGFGVRQSSGAFRSGPRAQKRQGTAAVQDASAPAAASSRFMVPMHAQEPKEALHEPAGSVGRASPWHWGVSPHNSSRANDRLPIHGTMKRPNFARPPFSGFLLLALFAATARLATGEPLSWQQKDGYRKARLSVPATGKTGFTLLTREVTGIQWTNRL